METPPQPEATFGELISKSYWYLKTLLARRIRETGLKVSPEQWSVMMCIHGSPGLTQTQISERVIRDKTGVTRILDGLEKRGYVRRTPDESDRRAYRIYLTDEGEDALRTIIPIAAGLDGIAMTGLDAEEREFLIGKLSVVRFTLEEASR